MSADSIWSYAPASGHVTGQDLTGFSVDARDGTIGVAEREADPAGMLHLVVDTAVWAFGRSVLVPAGAVTAVDDENRTISVACTRAEVKGAPRFETDSETLDPAYLASVAAYYRDLSGQQPLTS
ncbi:PRC-barrel domain containing protein [Streptomyces sp. NPDC091279]|uniref:PRC-barrel domain containing protein n=1 Tax=unclassified Streptomyces TaxID=2593676 RepID=UPI0037FC3445